MLFPLHSESYVDDQRPYLILRVNNPVGSMIQCLSCVQRLLDLSHMPDRKGTPARS